MPLYIDIAYRVKEPQPKTGWSGCPQDTYPPFLTIQINLQDSKKLASSSFSSLSGSPADSPKRKSASKVCP